MPVHEKILRRDKEKAKYCYLTVSIFISFFGDIFSLKRLTAARAMLHRTRRKVKNRGDHHVAIILPFPASSPSAYTPWV